MRIHEVDAGGVPLAVREWEGGAGSLVAWHALGPAGSGHFVDVFAAALAAHCLHPFAVDAPGFARSPARPTGEYAVATLAQMLRAAIAALDLERPVLLGHGWGGAVVLEAARQDPGRAAGLVLLEAGHADYGNWPTVRPQATLEELVEAARAADDVASSWTELEQELAAAYPGLGWLPGVFREGTVVTEDGRVLAGSSAAVRGAAQYGLERARSSDAWRVLHDAGVPALFLLATVPDLIDRTNRAFAPLLQQAWPDAEIVHLAGATSTIYTELGAELGEVVGGWARRRGIA